ncbi:hypothetical protein [Synechococcus elongatus]
MSEQEFYQSSRYSSSQKSRDSSGQKLSGIESFSRYDEYCEWFVDKYPMSKPLDREKFYQSSRYKRTSKTSYEEHQVDKQTQNASTSNLTVNLVASLNQAPGILMNHPNNRSTD